MTLLTHLVFDPHALDAIQGKHHIPLVVVSWLIALIAAYTGLDIIKLIGTAKRISSRWIWLMTGASVMGFGVWSMHFTGMHAYQLDFAVSHAPLLTMLSMVPAVLGSLGVMLVASSQQLPHRSSLLAGVGLGVGTGLMHYMGMAAMSMPAVLYHSLGLFLVSLGVALGLGIISVYAYRLCRQEWGRQRARRCALISALCVSLAISGMHYVAMQAAWFVPDSNASSMSPVDTHSYWLIYLIIAGALMMALLTLIATRVERRVLTSEHQQHMTRARLLEVISAIRDGIVLFDDSARIRLCNKAFEKLLGWDADESIGRSVWELSYVDDSQALNHRISRALEESGEWTGMIEAQHRGGRYFSAWLSVSRVCYVDTAECDYVALISDRSAEQQAQQRIRYLAYHDSLTELPNRRSLQEHLEDFETYASDEAPLALLALLDIDRFKFLNDSLGQDAGDELLRQLARRLRGWVDDNLFVARLDGNEFALLTPLSTSDRTSAEGEAQRFIDRVTASLSADYRLHGHTYPCRLNIGMLVFSPQQRAGTKRLLKRTGLALLEAKRERSGSPRLFCPTLEKELEDRLTLERELQLGIANDELRLHLQPQVDALHQVVGAEALVRWEHPTRGQVSPGHFIPLAEECGLILPLGDWVLQEGCRILGGWRKRPELYALKLSINVSVRQFQQPDFVDQVLAAVHRHDVEPACLTLELTESLLLNDPQGTIEKMTQLRRIGIHFALDDFGTGYSSMAYLKSLPLDTLKIDVAFVRDLSRDAHSTPIAATIITLAKSLEMSVVAEGVETEVQRSTLKDLGCHIYQGYLFGRPVPSEEFHAMLTSVPRLPAHQ
ncbi:EAL domain-containing protein [Halomonas sp. Mc5H-6]|jgi:diguanylate cyclase (GGDEF)-like protein/PAS domain S-box-containing protein|uniref:EAL domain-containing protein n=1 Tax=Halomonas sp. Mc5H-6 TaxID=2954500 RepID=UPI0020972613|nr:EAL domain-containing protein [Halomonas sp. Mc5H-6]MCO7248196.1 EAL domain-containing protein [Halomonas sp. Mc5H-6]|tara:strand:+ start:4957 stop:7464 length:2508 start_codon:yes stop_codon:yes gene_type:complete